MLTKTAWTMTQRKYAASEHHPAEAWKPRFQDEFGVRGGRSTRCDAERGGKRADDGSAQVGARHGGCREQDRGDETVHRLGPRHDDGQYDEIKIGNPLYVAGGSPGRAPRKATPFARHLRPKPRKSRWEPRRAIGETTEVRTNTGTSLAQIPQRARQRRGNPNGARPLPTRQRKSF